MQDRTYSDLLTLIQSLVGAGSLTTEEQSAILSFVNRRSFEAYLMSQNWPRYLVVGEERDIAAVTQFTVDDGTYTKTYTKVADANGKAKFEASTGETILWNSTSNEWVLLIDGIALRLYTSTEDTTYPWEVTSWTGGSGTPIFSDFVQDPDSTISYTLAGKNNIHEFIRIHRTKPWLRNSALEFDFYVDSDGAHILNLTTADANSAFVTYKKELQQFTGSSTDIPGEWFFFLAHGAYCDFLRLQGKQEIAMAEENIAQNYLAMELEKVDNMMNNNTALKRFSTYVGRQAR